MYMYMYIPQHLKTLPFDSAPDLHYSAVLRGSQEKPPKLDTKIPKYTKERNL